MFQLLKIAAALTIAHILFCGCAGSESNQIGRARLVGNENIKLKKQISDKDSQIKALEQKIADLEAEKVEIQQECGDTNFKIMQIVAETEKRNAELTAENQALKDQLATN